MWKFAGVLAGLVLIGCATQSEPVASESVRLRFVPGAEAVSPMEKTEGAVWTSLNPSPNPNRRELWLTAHAAIGDSFPVQKEEGPELFKVVLIDGNDARLQLELRTAEGTTPLTLPRGEQQTVDIAGTEFRLLYPETFVSADATRSETNKAAIFVMTAR